MVPVSETEAKEMISQFKQTEIGIKGQKAKMNYKDYYDKMFQ
jgi:hypothetical protein